jgi:hypothetical protein
VGDGKRARRPHRCRTNKKMKDGRQRTATIIASWLSNKREEANQRTDVLTGSQRRDWRRSLLIETTGRCSSTKYHNNSDSCARACDVASTFMYHACNHTNNNNNNNNNNNKQLPPTSPSQACLHTHIAVSSCCNYYEIFRRQR